MTVLYFVCPDDVSSQTDKEERDPEFDVMSMPVYLQLYDMLLKVDIRWQISYKSQIFQKILSQF